MCVRCSEVPRVSSRSVPIKFLRKAIQERETVEAVDGTVTQVIWYKTEDAYIASVDY